MNHNLTNVDLLRIFASKLMSMVRFSYKEELDQEGVLTGLMYDENNNMTFHINFEGETCERKLADVKLLLTPIHQISLTDMVNYSVLQTGNQELSESDISPNWKDRIPKLSRIIAHNINEALHCSNTYLMMKGYDVPMWFGLNHPDNGKSLTEIGIAVENIY